MRKYNLIAMLVFLLSAFVRFYKIGDQSYSLEEINLLHLVTRGWSQIFAMGIPGLLKNNNVFYDCVLKIWVSSVGIDEVSTRALSLFFSMMATWMVGRLAFLIFESEEISLLAMFFHAVSAYSVLSAQETGAYAFLELAAVVNIYWFFNYYFKNGKRASYIYSCLFLLLVGYAGLVLILFEGLVIAVGKSPRESQQSKKRLILSGFIVVALFVAGYFAFRALHFSPFEIYHHLCHLSYWACAWYPIFFMGCFFEIKKDPRRLIIFGFLIGAIIFCLTIGEVASLIFNKNFLWPEDFIFLNPFFILILCACLISLKKRPFIMAAVTFSVIMLAWLPRVYFPVKAPWNRLAREMSIEGGTVAVTTRFISIATPYFDQNHIEVRPLDSSEEGLQNFVLTLTHGKSESTNATSHRGMLTRKTWVIENSAGAAPYFKSLQAKLTSAGVFYSMDKFENSVSDALTVIKIN